MTRQNRNIWIAGDQRDRNCKIGEEVGSPVKRCRRTCRRTRRISHHHFLILSGKKQMLEHTQQMQNLLLRQKNRHAQDDMHDMAAMVQCNLSNLIGTGVRTNNY